MLIVIIACTAVIALFLAYRSLREQNQHYSDLTLGDVGTYLATALVPGIFVGMAVMFLMTRFFSVREIGHTFAPSHGMDLIYKVRVKAANGKESVGEAYVYYDSSPGEDDCGIEVEQLVFGGRTYEVDSDEGYCLYGFGRWDDIGLMGRSGVEVMLLDEKVGEH